MVKKVAQDPICFILMANQVTRVNMLKNGLFIIMLAVRANLNQA